MTMLAPDLIVHLPTLMDGITFAHRLTGLEHSGGWIATGVDLAPLLRWSDTLVWDDGSEVEIDTLAGGQGIIVGPIGWLERFEPQALVGFRVEEDTLSLGLLEDPGPPDPGVVEALRAAYEREVAEPCLPVRADEIVAGALLEHPGIWSTPMVPLSELLEQAGLEQRGVEFAHDESVWHCSRLPKRDQGDGQVGSLQVSRNGSFVLGEPNGRPERTALGLQLPVREPADAGREVHSVRKLAVDQCSGIPRHDHHRHRLCHSHSHPSDPASAKPQPGFSPLARQSRSRDVRVNLGFVPQNRPGFFTVIEEQPLLCRSLQGWLPRPPDYRSKRRNSGDRMSSRSRPHPGWSIDRSGDCVGRRFVVDPPTYEVEPRFLG
jgi:hypothetical protein